MQTRQLVHFAATTSLLHRPAPACGLASRVPPIACAGDTGAIPRNETRVTHCSEIASTNERFSRSGSNLVDTSTTHRFWIIRKFLWSAAGRDHAPR